MQHKGLLLILVFSLFLLGSCAEVQDVNECLSPKTYGFLGGLWHGIIAPFSFVFSLFVEDVAVYAVNNTGGWYDFGFLLGAGVLFGGSSKASKPRKKKA